MVLIALIMEAASTSETSVNFYQTTRRNNPEDSHLHTRRRENLKFRYLFCYLRVFIWFMLFVFIVHYTAEQLINNLLLFLQT
jgi:hypothetical protein